MIKLKTLLLESNQLMRILDHLMNAINKEAKMVGQSASFYEPTEFKEALKNVQNGVKLIKRDSSMGTTSFGMASSGRAASIALDDLIDDAVTLGDMFGDQNSARGEKVSYQLYTLLHKFYKQ